MIYKTMRSPEKILITILLGNIFVNIVVTAISTKLFLFVWGEYGHFIAIAIVSPIIIILCEISPKTIAINNFESISRMVIPFLNIFHKGFLPLRSLLLAFVSGIISLFNLKLDGEQKITEEELDMAIKMGEEEQLINPEEVTFIQNVMRFSKKDAFNVVIPRNKAVFVHYQATIKEAVDIMLDAGVVRAPVYKKNIDDIVGVIDSRELIPHIMGFKKAKYISRFIHDIYHYPEKKELGEFLKEFLTNKIQIAIVVDEYGGTTGVVTLSSIISELMGKDFIMDEQDQKPNIKQIDDQTCIISGEMHIDDVNVHFDESLQSDDSETIAGYIIEKLGHFPKRNEQLITEKYIFKVRHIKKTTIETIEVIVKEGGADRFNYEKM